MSESASPEAGPMSVEDAVAALSPEPAEQDAPEAPVEAAAEAQETEGETSAPEEAEGEAEQPAEAEETEAEPEPVVAVEPPKYWSQDAKAEFAQLPPSLQAVVLAQEGPREEAAAKAKADAAAQVAVAKAEMGKIAQLSQELSSFLPQAIETFRSRWGEDPDWEAVAAEHGTEAMTLAKVRYDAERGNLQRLAVATQEAQQQAHAAYVEEQFEKLAEIAPDLTDPEKGVERRAEITQYLEKAGVERDQIREISAVEMNLARKAMLYDKAQAALQARPKPAPPAPAPRAPVRPAAAPAQPSQRSALQQAQAKFNLNPSADNAEALLLAQRASRQ